MTLFAELLRTVHVFLKDPCISYIKKTLGCSNPLPHLAGLPSSEEKRGCQICVSFSYTTGLFRMTQDNIFPAIIKNKNDHTSKCLVEFCDLLDTWMKSFFWW